MSETFKKMGSTGNGILSNGGSSSPKTPSGNGGTNKNMGSTGTNVGPRGGSLNPGGSSAPFQPSGEIIGNRGGK